MKRINAVITVITAANPGNYNRNMIFGGDLRVEWRKIVSLLAGADRYKFHWRNGTQQQKSAKKTPV